MKPMEFLPKKNACKARNFKFPEFLRPPETHSIVLLSLSSLASRELNSKRGFPPLSLSTSAGSALNGLEVWKSGLSPSLMGVELSFFY